MHTPPKAQPDVKILEDEQPEQEKEDVLRAMLYVAEDEIRAKEVQVELMQQMLVTTEQEIGHKDDRIGDLVSENTKLRDELSKFALLFDKYLSKSEGKGGSLAALAAAGASAAATQSSSSQSADTSLQGGRSVAAAAAAPKAAPQADSSAAGAESRRQERVASREASAASESRAVEDAALLQEDNFDE